MRNHSTHRLSKVTVAFSGPKRKKELLRKAPEGPVVGIDSLVVLSKSRVLAASETESFSQLLLPGDTDGGEPSRFRQ